jgi:hypothetical protein
MEAHMTRQEIIKALDAVGVTEGDIKELRKGSLQFYLNDQNGFDYRCAVNIAASEPVWEAYYECDTATFPSLDELIEDVCNSGEVNQVEP